jgi:hypothetical protein
MLRGAALAMEYLLKKVILSSRAHPVYWLGKIKPNGNSDGNKLISLLFVMLAERGGYTSA